MIGEQRQKDILAYIRTCIANFGNAPTRREIADHFGFTSANAAQEYLKAMEANNMIELTPRLSRGIRVVR